MAYNQQKSNTVGSAYVNCKKGTPQETVDRVRKGVEFFKDNNVHLSLSMKNGNGSYNKFTVFFNTFKRSPKDPDLIVRDSQPAQAARETKPAYKPVERKTNDTIPF